MKSPTKTIVLALSILIFPCVSAYAEVNAEIKQLQQEWARIKYTLDKELHEDALQKLSLKAVAVREEQTNNADAHLWEGIILSTYAGAIGTLRALEAVTQSRDALERSLSIDPGASKGAANTYLGSLYFLVPEWPIGFGDFELAEQYLSRAIELNPDDIDVNFFYGYFLGKQKKYKAAEESYNRAIRAPARIDRQLADEGRRKEAKERLGKLSEKLNPS